MVLRRMVVLVLLGVLAMPVCGGLSGCSGSSGTGDAEESVSAQEVVEPVADEANDDETEGGEESAIPIEAPDAPTSGEDNCVEDVVLRDSSVS